MPTFTFKTLLVTLLLLFSYDAATSQCVTVSTFAGSGSPTNVDGTGTAASILNPTSIFTDASGNVYVNSTVGLRKITPAGVVTTMGITSVRAAAYDAAGNLYVANFADEVRKITPGGTNTLLAGGVTGYQDGIGAGAQFDRIYALVVDTAGNVYTAEATRIRKITPTGVVTTLAGSANMLSVDGTGTAAGFNAPSDMGIDSFGNLYVLDQGDLGASYWLRKVTPAGVVTTLASSFSMAAGLAVDAYGNSYVSSMLADRIYKVTPTGTVTTYAGSTTNGYVNGFGTVAVFADPEGLAIDPVTGSLYVADRNNMRVRKITPGPTALVATARTCSGFTANWQALPGATGYRLDVSTTPDFSSFVAGYQDLNVGNVTSYLVAGLTYGPYYYRVRATGLCTPTVPTDNGNAVSVTVSDVPITLEATARTCSGFTANWMTVAGATNYRLDVSTAADFSSFVTGYQDLITGNVTSFAVTGLNPATTYYYRLRASLPCGISESSNPITIGPETPTFTAQAATGRNCNSFIANWTAAPAAIDYRLDVSTAANFSSFVPGYQDIAVGTGTSFTVNGTDPTLAYYYRLRAVFACGTSPSSNVVTASPLPPIGGETSTLAGNIYGWTGNADGIGSAASFDRPNAVATDSAGNIYVAEEVGSRIRKITPVGEVTTLATGFGFLTGIVVDSDGIIYVSDRSYHQIWKVLPDGTKSVFVGSGTAGYADGTGTAAQFNNPYGLDFDTSGNLFVTDAYNRRIRKITPSGVVTTFAGSGATGSTDGIGTAASFNLPYGLALDASNNIYVSDYNNGSLRKITPAGVVSTLVSTFGGTFGYEPGIGGLDVDPYGNIYLTAYNYFWIKKITPDGTVSNLLNAGGGNINGTANVARLYQPHTVTVDNYGNLYVADYGNMSIRKVRLGPTALPATVRTCTGFTANWQAYTAAATAYLLDVSTVPDFSSFVPGYENLNVGNVTTYALTGLDAVTTYYYRLRAITCDNRLITQYGNPMPVGGFTSDVSAAPVPLPVTVRGCDSFTANWNATAGAINYYLDVSTAADFSSFISGYEDLNVGNVTNYSVTGLNSTSTYYYRLRVVSSCGTSVSGPSGVVDEDVIPSFVSNRVSTLAGSTSGYLEGTGTAARFQQPTSVAVDNVGNVYVVDYWNNRIRKITPAGETSLLAGSGALATADGTGTGASFNLPFGIVLDAAGNAYVSTTNGAHQIRKITPAGVVTTFVGNATPGFANGTGTSAQFNQPYGLAMDAGGNIYVADGGNRRIRKVTPGGVVTTIAGSGVNGYVDAIGTAAAFRTPSGVAVDPAGNIYVADRADHRIRKITPDGIVTTLAGDGTAGYADGVGTAARFNSPYGLALDAFGNLYVADHGNNMIRKIRLDGSATVSTLAGSTSFGNTDGIGTAARFSSPAGVAVDASGNLYIADRSNNRIRKAEFTQLTMSGRVCNGFTLGWTAVVGAENYLVDISTSLDFSSFVPGYEALSTGGALSLSVTGLDAATKYYCRIRAVKCSNSYTAYSTVLTVNPFPAAAIPTATAATGRICNSFTANWNAVAGVTDYRLDVSLASDFSSFVTGYENRVTGNVTSLSVTGVSADVPYYYRVRSVATCGVQSASSSTITVTTFGTPGLWTGTAGDSDWHNTANWNNCTVPVSGDVLIPSATATAPQNVPTVTLNSLTVNNVQGIRLVGDVTLTNALTLTNAVVDAQTNNRFVRITNPAANAVTQTNGRVAGRLQRAVAAGTSYDWPIGTLTNDRFATLGLNSVSGGLTTIEVRFVASAPSAFSVAEHFTDNSFNFNLLLSTGYWQVTPDAGTANWDLEVFPGFNYSGMEAVTLVKKHETDPWSLDGSTGVYPTSNGVSALGGIKRTGFTSFSDIAVAGSSIALPVEGLHLTGQMVGTDGVLHWSTLAEHNDLGFALEHSRDGQAFEEIAFIPGAGNSTHGQNYTHTHKNLTAGMHIYRLRQMDFDGQMALSNTVELYAGASPALQGTTLYPNPANSEVTILLPSALPVEIELIDATGREVLSQASSGSTEIKVNTSGLASGIYQVWIRCGAESRTIRLFVQ